MVSHHRVSSDITIHLRGVLGQSLRTNDDGSTPSPGVGLNSRLEFRADGPKILTLGERIGDEQPARLAQTIIIAMHLMSYCILLDRIFQGQTLTFVFLRDTLIQYGHTIPSR